MTIRRDLTQQASSESLAQHRKASALIIVQSEPAASQLRLEGAVLFAAKGNHIALLGVEPPKQRRQQHLQRNHT